MNRSEAIDFVNQTTTNKNLVKHMVAVGACMRALSAKFGGDTTEWEVVGIVHDGTYEKDPEQHPLSVVAEVGDLSEAAIYAIKAHGWKHIDGCPEPVNPMDWSLYCADGLTGLITSVALTRPSKKLAEVEVGSIKKKWGQKAFAAGVDREQIALCTEKLGMDLDEFLAICLMAMQGVSGELGL